jgi:hypothetical protein
MAEQHYPVEYPVTDAVLGQYDANGNYLPKGALSLTEIEVLDLICEGEIQGLVTGYYPPTGTSGNAGEIGWQYNYFHPYPNPPNSTSKFLRSIYWGEVPVVSSDNKYNFQRIDTSYSFGTPDGSLVNQSDPELTITRQIGERLRGTTLSAAGQADDINKDYTKYYRILNKECQAADINVKFTVLSETISDPENKNEYGNTYATTVEYEGHYRPLFSTVGKTPPYYYLGFREKVKGKLNYGYIKSSRITFYGNFQNEKDFVGWEIKIIRITPDSLGTNLRNQTFIDSLTEIYSDTYLYPNSAIVRSRFSAEFFSQIPTRAFEVELLKVKIPDTYDPRKKTYTEPAEGWSGSFHSSKQWTDNPAWCYYDLLTNQRYGLGKYLPEANIDKWTLYEIGKYCDQLVPDGYGGLEPRFTCNLSINSRDEAYKVINDMASIFRGITYYAGGTIYTVQDSPKDPIYQFTNDNVEDGNFVYSSSSQRVRHTVAIVRYNDKTNFYRPAIEYVEDFDGIRQYGIRELEINAFGCTSRGQAKRLGKWVLLTEKTETETVSFNAGIEGSFIRPGDIIQVFDSNRKLNKLAGRTLRIDNEGRSRVLLDSYITGLNTGSVYKFDILTPSYYYNPIEISDLSGVDYNNIRRPQLQSISFTGYQASGITVDGNTKTEITFDTALNTSSYNVTGNLVWSIELYSGYLNTTTGTTTINESYGHLDKYYDYYRVIKNQEEDFKCNIIALNHNILKYNDLETGLFFDRPVREYKTIPEPPQALSVYPIKRSRNTRSLGFSYTPVNYSGITSYRVYADTNPSNILTKNPPEDRFLVSNLPADVLGGTLNTYTTGTYYFKVFSSNDEANILSPSGITGHSIIEGSYPIRDVIISSLRIKDVTTAGLSGDKTKSGVYDLDSPVFTWQVGLDANSINPLDFKYRISVRPPSLNNIPSSTIYYQDTGYAAPYENPRFQFDLGLNINISGGPYRKYDLVVEAIDPSGKTSAGNSVTTNYSYTENGWSSNPYGYDIVNVDNPRITGIYLTSGNSMPSDLRTQQWIDADGSIKVLITSGNLPAKTVGGYIYSSSGFFTTSHLYSGLVDIIEMNPITPASNFMSSSSRLNYTNSGWMAIALYDKFDSELQKKGIYLGLDLPVSNIVPVYASGDLHSFRATRRIDIYNTNNLNDFNSLQMERASEDSKTYAYSKFVDNDGREFIGASRLI